MKWFAIMDGDMFLQDVVPNKNYIRTGRAIQTNLHSYNEFSPVFAHEEKWFDSATISGMLPLLYAVVHVWASAFLSVYIPAWCESLSFLSGLRFPWLSNIGPVVKLLQLLIPG